MDENRVIAALCPYLEWEGYRIKQRLTTTEHGVDVIAEHVTSGQNPSHRGEGQHQLAVW